MEEKILARLKGLAKIKRNYNYLCLSKNKLPSIPPRTNYVLASKQKLHSIYLILKVGNFAILIEILINLPD